MLILAAHSFERNQRESPLLRLPGEIRNKIYGYVYDTPPEYALDMGSMMRVTGRNKRRHHLSTVCRTIYKEVRLLFLANATL